MRIGIVHMYGLAGSGSAIYVSRLAETLSSRGHYVAVLCYEQHPENYAFVDAASRGRDAQVTALFQRRPDPTCWLHQLSGMAPVMYPRVEAPDRPLLTQLSDQQIVSYMADLVDQIIVLIRRHQIEMLHVNHAVLLPSIAARIRKRIGLPYVVTIHGSDIEFVINRDERFRKYAYEGLAAADRVIVLNQDVWARAEALCPVARLTEIPVGVNTEIFQPAPDFGNETWLMQDQRTPGDAPDAAPGAPGDVMAVILAGGKGKRMKSDLPKVLHILHGRSLVQHVIDRVRQAGVENIVLVVGYQRDQLMTHLGPGYPYAVQEPQLGTAHAVMMARSYLSDFAGRVLVVYGDMPLINPHTVRRLIHQCRGDVKAVLLTTMLDNPPDFGRVLRGEDGRVIRIVEVKDADPETLAIKEINVGLYCFECRALLQALDRLSNDNAQGEYYLTDAVEAIVSAGGRIETLLAPTLEETLGINDPNHLRFAESLRHLDYAESVYPLVDASLAESRETARRPETAA